MNVDNSGPEHLAPVVGEAREQVPLVVAETVGDEEDVASLRLLIVGRLLVLLAWQGQSTNGGEDRCFTSSGFCSIPCKSR